MLSSKLTCWKKKELNGVELEMNLEYCKFLIILMSFAFMMFSKTAELG